MCVVSAWRYEDPQAYTVTLAPIYLPVIIYNTRLIEEYCLAVGLPTLTIPPTLGRDIALCPPCLGVTRRTVQSLSRRSTSNSCTKTTVTLRVRIDRVS